jgi:hypothetical protein
MYLDLLEAEKRGDHLLAVEQCQCGIAFLGLLVWGLRGSWVLALLHVAVMYWSVYSLRQTHRCMDQLAEAKAGWEELDRQLFTLSLERHLTFVDRVRGRMSGPH